MRNNTTTPALPPNTRQPVEVPESTEKFNPTLHAWLTKYVDETGLTRTDIGKRLGYKDGSTVSRYLSKSPAGDIAKFEALLADFKHRVETLRDSSPSGQILDTSVLRQSQHFCELVRSSQDVGILHGPAGIGKTTALRDHAAQHPTTFYTETNAAQGGARGMINLIWSNLQNHNGHSYSQSRWSYIVDQFKGSERLLIIDNAQRLDKGGRDMLFDFHDATKCPIVLSGNPSILSDVEKNDQQHSRCLIQHQVKLKPEEIGALAQQLTQRHLPNCPEVWPYAEQVAAREGYLRSLEKVLKTAAAFSELNGLEDPIQAFKAAHSKSTRNYKLID